MKTLILALVALILGQCLELKRLLKPASAALHKFCLLKSPESAYSELYKGIVCAASLEYGTHRLELLKWSGLLHLVVVSGSHLHLLKSQFQLISLGLKKLLIFFCHSILFTKTSVELPQKFSIFCLSSFLIFYALVCKLDPPIVRALFGLGVAALTPRLSLGWSGAHQACYASLLGGLVFPEFKFSLSYQLSCMASLAISMKAISASSQQLLLSLILAPLLMPLGGLSWVSLPMNLILGPLIGGILFPISLISFIFKGFTPLSDFIWSLLLLALESLKTESITSSNPSTFQVFGLIYCIGAHIIWIKGQKMHEL